MINGDLHKNSYEDEYEISFNSIYIIFVSIIEANSNFYYLCRILKIQPPSTKKKEAEYPKQPHLKGLR